MATNNILAKVNGKVPPPPPPTDDEIVSEIARIKARILKLLEKIESCDYRLSASITVFGRTLPLVVSGGVAHDLCILAAFADDARPIDVVPGQVND